MKLYDYDEAATELRVERRWLQRNIRELPHTKKGRKVTFTDDDLQRIEQMHHHEPLSGPLARPMAPRVIGGAHPLADLRPLPGRRKTA